MRALLLLLVPAVAYADAKDDCLKAKGRWLTDATGTGCMIAGKRDGVWEKREPSGQLDTRVTYKAGVKEGKTASFFPNCHIEEKGAWANDQKDGDWATWTEEMDGSVVKSAEGPYKAGVREGVWKFYVANIAVIEGPMVDDSADGEFTERFTTGITWRKVKMAKGKRDTPEAKACEEGGGSWDVDYKERVEGCTKDDKRDGTWLGYSGDGKLAWKSTFVKGLEEGEHTDFHPDGKILRKGQYKAGVPEGVHEFRSTSNALFGSSTVTNGVGDWRAWSTEGVVSEEGAYADHKKAGLWKSYGAKGALLDEVTWKAGKKTGPYRKYYATGEIEVVGMFEEARRSGLWRATYPNGNVVWTGHYDDEGYTSGFWYFGNFDGTASGFGMMSTDRRNGVWTTFHQDGVIEGIGAYVGGRKAGMWFEWWPSGKFWRQIEYVNDMENTPQAKQCALGGGQWQADDKERALGCQVCRSTKEDDDGPIDQLKTGPWTWWHANAAIEKRGGFILGKREGHWQTWFDNGELMLEGDYHEDKEAGSWHGFYRTKQKRFDGGYKDGNPEGAWTSYHEDGSAASSGSYINGKKVGLWKYLYPGGAVKEQGEYTEGAPSGTWTSFYANGAKASEGAYANGKRDGVWTYWRADGSVWRTETFKDGKRQPETPPATGSSSSHH